MQLFFDQTLEDLKSYCRDNGVPTVHATAMYKEVYKTAAGEPARGHGLPKALAARVAADFDASSLTIATELRSDHDSSVKLLVGLRDGAEVEAVIMPETARITLCVSSQVGCAQACVFCQTGRMGLKRNLSAGEIVAQVVTANRWIAAHPEWLIACGLPATMRITNIVFMGMGEPLDNPEAVCRALTILTEPAGLNLTKRKISVSTAGHLDGLEYVLARHPDARFAISVHQPDDGERSRIMPINRRWPLSQVMDRLRVLSRQQGDRDIAILIQYTLIDGVNDSPAHAAKLVDLLGDLPVKVNLIPWNPVMGSSLAPPSEAALVAFKNILYHAGLRVMVRFSKGQDIRAACGQLVTKSAVRRPAPAVAGATQ